MKTRLGWHFLVADRTLRTGERVQVGGRYTTTGPLVLCRNGLHASRRVLDALAYAPGPIVCRVHLLGEILLGTDKAVARTRQVLWMADATLVLHDFALSVATNALELTDTTDLRCWAALDVKRRWLHGQATDQELDAARDAAEDAAEDADRATWAAARATWAAAKNATWAARDAAVAAAEAARDAARDTTAWSAAQGATRAVTWAAAKDATMAAVAAVGAATWADARDAAWDATWAAAKAATRTAARAATWDAYNFQLETMLESLRS